VRQLIWMTQQSQERAYKSLVRFSLEYACSVWNPYTKISHELVAIPKTDTHTPIGLLLQYKRPPSTIWRFRQLRWVLRFALQRKYKFDLENEILFFFTFDFKIKLYIQEIWWNNLEYACSVWNPYTKISHELVAIPKTDTHTTI
jgi:hypothetical protein